jgi:hypothetical protein
MFVHVMVWCGDCAPFLISCWYCNIYCFKSIYNEALQQNLLWNEGENEENTKEERLFHCGLNEQIVWNGLVMYY